MPALPARLYVLPLFTAKFGGNLDGKYANGRAYNRTSFLPQRRKMMQAWANYLDSLRDAPGKVVPIKRKA